MRGLTDKGVLVSGGSSGIGKATVRRFLEEGSRVVFCGHDEGEVRATTTEARAARVGRRRDVRRGS